MSVRCSVGRDRGGVHLWGMAVALRVLRLLLVLVVAVLTRQWSPRFPSKIILPYILTTPPIPAGCSHFLEPYSGGWLGLDAPLPVNVVLLAFLVLAKRSSLPRACSSARLHNCAAVHRKHVRYLYRLRATRRSARGTDGLRGRCRRYLFYPHFRNVLSHRWTAQSLWRTVELSLRGAGARPVTKFQQYFSGTRGHIGGYP